MDRKLFESEGDLTIKQLKKLRKQSSLFVKETFCQALQDAVNKNGLQDLCEIEPEPNGEGDRTYPEPRKVFVRYQTLFAPLPYIKAEIVLEIGARSLMEPTETMEIKSMISEVLPIETTLINSPIVTAVPEKTFLEKAFLLHELFTSGENMLADRKSRHLYDLEKMQDMDFAIQAISNNQLWSIIHRHRKFFTRVNGVDYSKDMRENICLIPPPQVIEDWRKDYEKMQTTMIYGNSLTFNELIDKLKQLSIRIRNTSIAHPYL